MKSRTPARGRRKEEEGERIFEGLYKLHHLQRPVESTGGQSRPIETRVEAHVSCLFFFLVGAEGGVEGILNFFFILLTNMTTNLLTSL